MQQGLIRTPRWWMPLFLGCLLLSMSFPARTAATAGAAPAVPGLHAADVPVPFLERARRGERPSGFAIRGIKGWGWTPDQYLQEVPILARYRMNFLMNCYLSLFSEPPSGRGIGTNEWWLPIPDPKKRAYEKVFRACRDSGITFCFAVNPQLASPRPLDPDSAQDFDQLWQHYAWAQKAGVKWFSLSLDDVSGVKIDGAEHAALVNKLLTRLRANDPDAQMIFCPTHYSGDGTDPGQKTYLEALARELDPDVYVFWTGPSVVPARISRQDAQTFKSVVRHRVILWDNYPVNDGQPALHLGPLTGRDRALDQELDGYISNPPFTENRINHIPLYTIADYTFDPARYDPERSIRQAIDENGRTPEQRAVLKDLVALFSAGIEDTGRNDVIARFQQITQAPDSRPLADRSIQHTEGVLTRLDRLFPGKYAATRAVLKETLDQMRALYQAKFGKPPAAVSPDAAGPTLFSPAL